jgi:hypothetical protein
MFYILVYKTGGGSISKVSPFQKEKKNILDVCTAGGIHLHTDNFIINLFLVCFLFVLRRCSSIESPLHG